MTWVCPTCATNNDESQEACFVCDTPKPALVTPSPSASSSGVCRLTATQVSRLGLTGNVTVPEKYNVIGAEAFLGRTDITSVTLHDGITKIEARAFSGCTALTAVRGGRLSSIGTHAFRNCSALAASARPTASRVASDAFQIDPPPRPAEAPPVTPPVTPPVAPTYTPPERPPVVPTYTPPVTPPIVPRYTPPVEPSKEGFNWSRFLSTASTVLLIVGILLILIGLIF